MISFVIRDLWSGIRLLATGCWRRACGPSEATEWSAR